MTDKNIDYNTDFQKLLLEFIISDNTLFSLSRTILKPEYWDREYRKTIDFILKYADQFNNTPTSEIVKAETRVDLKRIENITSDISDWFLESVENFCKHKAMEKLILDGPSLLEKGEYNAIEERSKENVMISLQKDLGLDYYANPKERIEKVKDRKNIVSTGWKSLDEKLYGGFNRGELTFWAGGSGSGKSLFLQNMAINWSLMGLNIIYITLELSEILVSLRLDAMVSGMSTKNVIKDTDTAAMKIVALARGEKTQVKPGKIQVKKMSEAGTTINDIRAYIKEYEIQTGLKVDGICVDYLDLLYPNSARVDINSSFTKDKYTSEELRGLAAELNILCVSASQLNRCLAWDTEVYCDDSIFKDEKPRKRNRADIPKKHIKDVKIGDWVLGQNDFVRVSNVFPQGDQMTYKVTLDSGLEIICTDNHRFPTTSGLRSMRTGLEEGVSLYEFEEIYENDPLWKERDSTKFTTHKIVSIVEHGIVETYDIEVESESHLFVANGILTHNSSVQETDYDMSHIAGGISKINTADNVIAILTSSTLRENGEYQIQFLKTRSSNGVGQRLYLSFDRETMRISDKVDPVGTTTPVNSKFSELIKNKSSKKEEKPKQVEEKKKVEEKPIEKKESATSTKSTLDSKILSSLNKIKKQD